MPGMDAPARVLSVNVGRPRTVNLPRRAVTTAIWKTPVEGPVAARGVNLAGDHQADAETHGGHDKAVYAYARADVDWWEEQLGRTLEPGCFGQNLDVEGLDVTGARVGERWAVGGAVLEVAGPRLPCFKLGLRMEDERFPRRFGAAGRPGAYLRIVSPGELCAGDPIEVLDRPAHDVTVGLVSHAALHDHGLAGRLLAAPALPHSWREWAQDRAA